MKKSLYRSIAALVLLGLVAFLPAATPAEDTPYELNGIFSTTGFGSFLVAPQRAKRSKRSRPT